MSPKVALWVTMITGWPPEVACAEPAVGETMGAGVDEEGEVEVAAGAAGEATYADAQAAKTTVATKLSTAIGTGLPDILLSLARK
jgi:hypothetical protein